MPHNLSQNLSQNLSLAPQQTMQAVIAPEPGDASVLELRTVEKPNPSAGEVRIRVHAFGLNKAEAYNRQGKHGDFSGKFALGIEAAGVIDLDPEDQFASGQKVVTAMGGMMFDRHGSYAEYIVVKRQNVVAVNSDLPFEDLATLPEAYLTVWGALRYNLDIQPGETLFIRGGTSSLGMAAITYAKTLGVTVIATSRKAERFDKLKALGTDHVLLDDGNLAENVRKIIPAGADKALEFVGAVTVKDTMQAIRPWGEVAFVGFVGGPPILENFHFMNDLPNTVKLSFFGSGLLGKDALPLTDAPIQMLADQLADGSLPSIKAQTFELSQIQEAHLLLESNEAFGKIVVKHS